MNYFEEISILDLRLSKISTICDLFWEQISKYTKMTSLNLAANKLLHIPENATKLNRINEVFLSGNPFHCDCDMTWMINWINNYAEVSFRHPVTDYKNMKCHSGKMFGKPIYQLDKVEMECYPHNLSTAQKVGIGVGTVLAVCLFFLAILISKRSREVKFFMFYYLKLDTVPKDDKNEDLTNIEYDAFFCYRSVSNKIK